MTAVACIRGPNRLYVLTDGATYDGEGRVQHIGSKVVVFPHLPAVIAPRGSALMRVFLQAELTTTPVSDFDQLLTFLPRAFAQACKRAESPDSPGKDQLIVAGISRSRQRAESYLIFAEPGWMPLGEGHELSEVEPFVLHAAPETIMSPAPSRELLDEFGVPAAFSFNTFHPQLHGLALMQAQRRTLLPGYSSPVVGAFAQLNLVWPDGVNSEILHRWPDRIGERIAPAGVAPDRVAQ